MTLTVFPHPGISERDDVHTGITEVNVVDLCSTLLHVHLVRFISLSTEPIQYLKARIIKSQSKNNKISKQE